MQKAVGTKQKAVSRLQKFMNPELIELGNLANVTNSNASPSSCDGGAQLVDGSE